MRFVLVLGLGASLLAGCASAVECSCAPEAPFLMIAVLDALDAGPIANARVNGAPCGPTGLCQFRSKPDGGPPGAGPVSLEATAPGYETQSLVVDVPAATPVQTECCGLTAPYVSQFRTVLLVPL